MKIEQRLHNLADKIQLSDDEKAALWLRIESQKHSIIPEVFVPAPSSVMNWFRYISYSAVPVVVFAFLMVSSASALPGEFLYGIKTGINEPLQRLTTVGSDNKIELEKRLLSRRVAEAKALKEMGLLDIETANRITDRISTQVAKATAPKIEEVKSDEDTEIEATTTEDVSEATEEAPQDDTSLQLAVAELRGTATGSIDSVKILVGGEINDEINDEISAAKAITLLNEPQSQSETQEKESSSALLQPYVSESEKDINPAKYRLQAKLKMATTQAEVAQVLLEYVNTTEATDGNDSDSNQDEKKRATELAKKKVSAAKEIAEKELDEVDEADLLEAVADASAAIAITESLLTEE